MSALAPQQFSPVRFEPIPRNEVEAALLCPEVFIARHCWIEGKGGRIERFRLWVGSQDEIIRAMDEEDRLIVLKARQLGISWCSDAYALWLCSANTGQTVFIFSKGLDEAQEEIRRIRFMHARLPPELRRRLGGASGDPHGRDNLSQLSFPETGSRIISMASTEHAGTSFTATLVIIQELAKIKNAASLMTSVEPTVADGGRMFIVSTALGYSGPYYELWRTSQDRLPSGQIVGLKGPTGSFRPAFIPWSARPGRDAAWYEARSRTLSVKEMRQEYPATPTEAFQGSTDAVFGEEFDRQVHALNQGRVRENTFPVVGGTDPGVNHGVAYLIEVQGRMVWVFAVVHLENASVEELGQAIYAECGKQGLNPADVLIYMDPFDVGRNAQTLKTDLDVLSEQGLLVDREDERYSPAQRTGLIKLLLKQRRIWVSTDCPELLDALERAPWKTHRAPTGEIVRDDTYAKDGVHEHHLDALGTALARIFPPVAAAGVETAATTFAAQQYAYSGSLYG